MDNSPKDSTVPAIIVRKSRARDRNTTTKLDRHGRNAPRCRQQRRQGHADGCDNVEDRFPESPIQLTIDYDLQAIAETDMVGQAKARLSRWTRVPAKFSPWSAARRLIATISPISSPSGRMAVAQYRSTNAAAESRHSGAACSGLGLQDCDGHGRCWSPKQIPENFTALLPGITRNFYGRDVSLLAARRDMAMVGLHVAIVDSCDVFFYNVGQKYGNRHDFINTASGLGLRHGAPGSTCRAKSLGSMPSEEWVAARLSPQMVRRRNHFRVHRAGRR